MPAGYDVGLIKRSRADFPARRAKAQPELQQQEAGEDYRMLSDDERQASFQAACELLKKHDRDWHDLVEAIERADILADPVPDPKVTERQSNNAWIAHSGLKRFDRFLDEAHKAFLQQVVDQPSKHDPATTYAAISDIIAQATAMARAHRRAKR